jgi:hypothetical protein
MSYKLSQEQFAATLKLNDDYRYSYFFNWVKKGLELFIIKDNDGPLMLEFQNESGTETILPIWPHEDFATKHAKEDETLSSYEVQSVSLAIFLEVWLPKLSDANINLAIFPLGNNECTVITASDFKEEFATDTSSPLKAPDIN